MARLLDYATANPLRVTRAVEDIGSGLSGRRRKLLALLKDAKIGTIIVEHRDRLTRFGAELIETALAASGRKVEVVDAGEMNDDLGRDLVDGLTRLGARLSGTRSAKNRAERALKAIESEK
jgi:predicted site-specific integrase-resolvase